MPGWWRRGASLLGRSWVLAAVLCVLAAAVVTGQYTPPCDGNKDCQGPITCFTCTDQEYVVLDNGVRGYPASAQCRAQVANCLYCWKQVHTMTLSDGWTSDFQFKSCVPWPEVVGCTDATCVGQYAKYNINYCQTFDMEKTKEACAAEGGWCTKKTTECACNTDLCNLGGRVAAHHLSTALFGTLALILLVRKCCVV
mmetsp:Transcript_27982/g.70548  ORF Transcript_27982/g.70548 Transcript_27982/m.70548 type:complete len:197 (+) Transcript_27982:167-757(+)